MTIYPVPKRVLLFGATGTAGRAAAQALTNAGHTVVAAIRPGSARPAPDVPIACRTGTPDDPASLRSNIFQDDRFDAVVSCIASRSGLPDDAWAVDHATNATILTVAKERGVPHMVLLSAICVQRPRLGFQAAKLAFEAELMASGLTYSIVRPTAFFKSLAGQIARVQAGRPFLVFGDGRLTAAKPISDRDLGRFLSACLTDDDKQNAILPFGGPGPALTPRDVGDIIFRATDKPPRFRHVPPWVMGAIISGLKAGAIVKPSLAQKAELARIGQYYGAESMLVFDADHDRYDAEATPEFGTDRFEDYVRDVIAGRASVDLGDHAVF